MQKCAKSCLLAALLTTTACSTVDAAFQSRRGAYTQNTADLQRDDVTSFVANQNSVMNRFVLLSGVEYDRRPLNMPVDLPERTPPPPRRERRRHRPRPQLHRYRPWVLPWSPQAIIGVP